MPIVKITLFGSGDSELKSCAADRRRFFNACAGSEVADSEGMSTITLVLIGVIVALAVPYLMRRRARLGQRSSPEAS
jgi:hypothetical protein